MISLARFTIIPAGGPGLAFETWGLDAGKRVRIHEWLQV